MTESKIIKIPEAVKLPRQLILGKWNFFSVPLLRILIIISSILSRKSYINKTEEISIPLLEWFSPRILGGETLTTFQNMAQNFAKIAIIKHNRDGNKTKIALFESFVFDKRTKRITLKLHPDFAYFFIPPNFVDLDTRILSSCRSQKTFHLYAILQARMYYGTKSISLQNLYYILDLKPSYRIISEMNRHFLKKIRLFFSSINRNIIIHYIRHYKRIVSLSIADADKQKQEEQHKPSPKSPFGIKSILEDIFQRKIISREIYQKLKPMPLKV